MTTITRKIQLNVVAPESVPEQERKKYKDSIWKRIRDANKLNFDLHNLGVKTLFSVDSLVELKKLDDQEYLDINYQYHLNEEDKKIKELRKNKLDEIKMQAAIDLGGILLNKDGEEKTLQAVVNNLVYHKINEYISKLPDNKKTLNTYTTAAISNNVAKKYSNDQYDVDEGNKTIANYRITQPIPINRRKAKWIEKVGDNYNFIFNSIKGDKVHLKMYFGRDRSDNKIIVDRILNENSEYKFLDSSVQLKGNKIFLHLVVKIPPEKKKYDPKKVLGVDLGVKYAAYLATNNSKEKKALGDGKFVLMKTKNKIEHKKRAAQRNATLNKGGKGRKKKLKKLNEFRDKEKNFRATFNHTISKQIVDHAIKWGCGTVNVENLRFANGDNKNRILRYWSYDDLLTKIEYKCAKYGIEFKKIDPKYTSQKCAVCGEIGKRDKQAEFSCQNPECVQYEIIVNADHNAAINIAKAEK